MIEETFNYLLTRSLLMSKESNDLIGLVDSKEIYKFFVDNISRIMQEEDYILVSDALIERVSNLIYHYRFDYIKNREINEQVNYIIGRLHDYKEISINRRDTLSKEWIKEERENRGLLARNTTIEDLFSMIALDGEYFYSMINIGEAFRVENLTEYLSLLNLLLNRFPQVFEDDLFLEITKQNCEAIKSIPKIPKVYLKMIKKILNRLEKEYLANPDINVQVKCYSKKKDK